MIPHIVSVMRRAAYILIDFEIFLPIIKYMVAFGSVAVQRLIKQP